MTLRAETALETSAPEAPAHSTIERLFERYQRQITAHLARLVGDACVAEDLCQDTFAKALRGWPCGEPPANCSAWLYRIATNTAYDHLRRRRRIHFAPLEVAGSAHAEPRDDSREEVRAALADVPERYRVPLLMHTCDGFTLDEIADRLGCTAAAVKMRLFRGRAHFRAAYARAGAS